jgi:hypothetical protein
MLNEIDMNYQSFSLRGLTKIAENLTAGSMYLVRLTNRHWYRVTIQKILLKYSALILESLKLLRRSL